MDYSKIAESCSPFDLCQMKTRVRKGDGQKSILTEKIKMVKKKHKY